MTQPIFFQRAEAGILLVAVILLYHHLGGAWWIFGLLFFAPDIFALGYVVNRSVGAASYNLGHSLAVPLVVLTAGVLTNQPTLQLGALIWLAHVGFDRMMGFSLKEAQGFNHTHLGRIGRSVTKGNV